MSDEEKKVENPAADGPIVDSQWVNAEEATGQGASGQEVVQDSGSKFGWGVLGFFIPLVGLILFIIWHGQSSDKRKAKAAGIGAIVGVALWIISLIIIVVLGVFAYNSANKSIENSAQISLSSSSYSSDNSDSDSDNSALQAIADSVNSNSATIVSAMGGAFSNVSASVENSNTLNIDYTFAKAVDPSVYGSDTMKATLKKTLIPAMSIVFEGAEEKGVKNMNISVEMTNPDGSDVVDITVTQADYDNYQATQASSN